MALPRVQPIRPTWRKDPFDHADWLFDMKADGFRGLCYVEHGCNRLISRNWNTFDRFADLADEVADQLGVREAVLDGEVIAADETGRPQFYELLRRTRTPAYVVFDLLWLDVLTADGAQRATPRPAIDFAGRVDDRLRTGVG
jgi:bifunctional non-homologous end joining protein LigD